MFSLSLSLRIERFARIIHQLRPGSCLPEDCQCPLSSPGGRDRSWNIKRNDVTKENVKGVVAMKRFIWCLFLTITFLLTVSNTGLAQNSEKESPPDQVMKDLLSEVRLLRQDLRKLSSTTYRAHNMIERLRIQQSQVNRLAAELSNVRGQLASIKSGRLELKEQIKELQKRWDLGTIPESELITAKRALADMDQREPDLTVKESELVGQLIIERANLEALNKRLDDIEQELLSITQDDDKRVKRNQ